MTNPTEQLGAAQFEKFQGVHQVTAVEVPPPSQARLRRTQILSPFFFEVMPRLPNEDVFDAKLLANAIYCYPSVVVERNTGYWVSKTRLPVLIAHGGRRNDNAHIIQSHDRLLGSESAVESLRKWCVQNAVPEPKIFVSCDERLTGLAYRWDQNTKTDILGFAGGLNIGRIDDVNNTFIFDKAMQDSELTEGTITGPFSSPTYSKGNIATSLFTLVTRKFSP